MAEVTDKFAKRTLIRKVQLPSKGKLYPELPTGEVRIGTITTREDKIFSGAGNSPAAKLDLVMDRCVDSGALPMSEMLLADRLFCLFHIRSLSYGDTYAFKSRCGACSRMYSVSVDLMKDLPVKMAGDDFKEPYLVKLPHSGHVLGLRHFRGKDEKLVAEYAEKHGGSAPTDDGDPAYFYRMARHIATIDEKPVPVGGIEAIELVQSLEGPDSLAFRNAMDASVLGFSMTLTKKCPMCKEEDEAVIPFSVEFFRPKS